jgi:hypothetical protein
MLQRGIATTKVTMSIRRRRKNAIVLVILAIIAVDVDWSGMLAHGIRAA